MRPVKSLTAAAAVLAALACSELTSLEQQDPSQILAREVYAPANAFLLVNGAIGDFECAYFRYVTTAGLLGDELVNAFANTTTDNYDRRTHPPTGTYAGSCGGHQNPGVYTSLSVARASADTILAKLEGWTDAELPTGQNRQLLIARAAEYAGYSLVLLGEGFCSAAINVGPEMTSAQLFTEARGRFDKAIAAATAANDATALNLARLGRARALLNLAFVNPASPDLALVGQAATDAALVPANFAVNAVANISGTTRQQNTIFAHTGAAGSSNFSSVDPTFAGVTFGGVADPRVNVTVTTGRGADGLTTIRFQNKYANLGAAAPIARAVEAQLIVAEANALGTGGGTPANAVTIINALHTAAGIPAYDPNAAGALTILAQVREERRRALFLEGQRLGDIRRLNLPLVPAIGTAFPRGGQYGDQRCMPIPAVERNNNPNIPDV